MFLYGYSIRLLIKETTSVYVSLFLEAEYLYSV